MEYRVELTRRAARDLDHIYQSIDAEQSEPAFAWFNGLEAAVSSLHDNPGRGAVTVENQKLRQLIYGNKPYIYRIIYRIDQRGRKVTVLHIRYGARDAFEK
jgi:plasmid stabilization system protein ParE